MSPLTILRTCIIISTLVIQSFLIVAAQWLGYLILPFSKRLFRTYIRHTMELWALHLVALNQYFSPAKIVLTADESITRETFVLGDGTTVQKDDGIEAILDRDYKGRIRGLDSKKMPWRAVLMANHQTYADWIYIWLVAFLSGTHGNIKIILKDDFRPLPIFGWAMRTFDFIFLKRKWAQDRDTIESNLRRSMDRREGLWLIVFPEGTVISDSNRKKSKEFAEKNGWRDPTFALLPRSTGLKLSTTTLSPTVPYIYDLTIGYDGIRPGQIPELVHTLGRVFFQGEPPARVHVHLRRFLIAELPEDDAEYAAWLRDRWDEKDAMLAHFYTKGGFPGEERMAPQVAKVVTEVGPDGGDIVLVMREEGVEIPMSATFEPRLNSVLDLTQVWFCLLPYLPVLQIAWAYIKSIGVQDAGGLAAGAGTVA